MQCFKYSAHKKHDELSRLDLETSVPRCIGSDMWSEPRSLHVGSSLAGTATDMCNMGSRLGGCKHSNGSCIVGLGALVQPWCSCVSQRPVSGRDNAVRV